MAYLPVLLATGSAAAVATLTVDLSPYYAIYSTLDVELYNIQSATDNVNFMMLVSVDGTTFDNASGNYQWQSFSANASPTSGAVGTNSATAIQLIGGIVGVGALASASAMVTVRGNNLSSATLLPVFRFESAFVTTGAFLSSSNFGTGTRTTAQITKALRFSFSSGNITTVSWRVRGTK